MKKQLAGVIAVTLLCTGNSYGASGIRDGLWEITSQPQIAGMQMNLPSSTIRHCYTKEDVKEHRKIVEHDKNCTLKDYKVSGNKIVWSMKCTGDNEGSFKGETTFSAESYSSVMKMNAEGQEMTVKVTGKRIGNCK